MIRFLLTHSKDILSKFQISQTSTNKAWTNISGYVFVVLNYNGFLFAIINFIIPNFLFNSMPINFNTLHMFLFTLLRTQNSRESVWTNPPSIHKYLRKIVHLHNFSKRFPLARENIVARYLASDSHHAKLPMTLSQFQEKSVELNCLLNIFFFWPTHWSCSWDEFFFLFLYRWNSWNLFWTK